MLGKAGCARVCIGSACDGRTSIGDDGAAMAAFDAAIVCAICLIDDVGCGGCVDVVAVDVDGVGSVCTLLLMPVGCDICRANGDDAVIGGCAC